MASLAKKRLSPDKRKAEIIDASIRLLSREGLDGYSLEAVAREARVAMTLPRHYFGGYRELLKASTESLLSDVERTLLGHEKSMSLVVRFSSYLELLYRNPWGHEVWMKSYEIHPDLHMTVNAVRMSMAQSIYRKKWDEMDVREKIDARGRIGYIETIVSEWLINKRSDREIIVGLIIEAITQPKARLTTYLDSRANQNSVVQQEMAYE